MVAAPPSSVGKFGGETDNWMWPRHTGDFSMFRIYADKNGEPAEYSKDNVPLQTPKYLPISIKGLQENDYAMIMGFPGRTSRYLTQSEVKERMEADNQAMIDMRGVRSMCCANIWMPAIKPVSSTPISLPEAATTGRTPSA